ncbi:hypothetical protein ALI144C_10290 [Actinosynnema sp. ALI-1.44]|uniref:STAS domain-containing protein n=1 Tax=Actinosynnema sp. ALI-1.44 TaxID=1933779 RepID=UPI00097BE68F|nr:STAS domain-containing protein [Actinosynnema sp. ALI-1.44]ONI87017.1 hypothetical protein ALI144C_10290 [Actinosynnema sp. ALI-1.44]
MDAGDSPVLDIATDQRADACVLTVCGEVDYDTADQLDEALGKATGPLLVVDLRPVTFMSSAGLAVLIKAQSRAETRDARFTVVCDGPVHHVITETGLHQILSVTDTVDV